ncbi:MAG: sporulation protein [Candidatus Syntrophonatronum acetioxidans]|uniref:Sporulation protein n=1 Tax=Candidatus Syntrophonatronum acetioxidans TaxID=1795816 RepID=A0A424YDU9_9FIRM|nr:MAG: sporulation protein [Candidatus Syntrophonatronum acetioxidans]
MDKFLHTLIYNFFIALGVILGGSFIGSLGAIFCQEPPLKVMLDMAGKLKIWALVSAIGGTFATIRIIETGFLDGQLTSIIKQFLFILSAFYGSHLGYLLIVFITDGN